MSYDFVEIPQCQLLISDEDIQRVHGSFSFGSMRPRLLVNEGILAYAFGYKQGSVTAFILKAHGLLTMEGDDPATGRLTPNGYQYLRAILPYDRALQIVAEGG